jgi:hypothetical protein
MSKRILQGIGILVGLWLGTGLLSQFVANWFWFAEVGYEQVFWLRLGTQTAIGAIATLLSLGFLLINLRLANRLKSVRKPSEPQQDMRPVSPLPTPLPPPDDTPILRLTWLLSGAIGLTLLISLLVLHYAQAAIALWNQDLTQLDVSPPLPEQFQVSTLWQLVQQLRPAEAFTLGTLLSLGWLVVGAIGPLIYPQLVLHTIAIGLSLLLGASLAAHWDKVLLVLNATPFNRTDPLFGHETGFYVFSLPLLELLEFWLVGMGLYALLAVALIYVLSGNSLSRGRFEGFSHAQRQHLWAVSGCLMLVMALKFWLGRYKLLYSARGVLYGAGYSDINVELPANTVLSLLAVAIALFLCWQAFGSRKWVDRKTALARWHLPPILPTPLFLIGAYAVLTWLTAIVLPAAVQSLVVQPNELAREQPYLRRSIALTREAFALDAITVETFDPVANLTARDIQENALTVRNIRLWDTRPLLQTNRQLQIIRPYYAFPDADIDRYTLPSESPTTATPTEKQQVLIAARELDYNSVPADAKTWVNQHLVYTHGYGFTLSPVNRVAPGGLPDYYVRDIGSGTDAGGLIVASQRIRDSIPTAHPRIYYGEITHTYVMTGTQVPELDYPSGNDNVYNTYDGTGGIGIGALWQRWLFARYLRDWQMIFTGDFTAQTKLLFRRTIQERVRTIAPFLRYDQDPYLVVADIPPTVSPQPPNYLYWVIDAYTTSDRYPYSDPGPAAIEETNGKPFNYIRNSIKVIVDAYNGSVDFYIADPNDPIIQSWSRIFPGMFKPLAAMPAALRSHIRYPEDMFRIQSERLLVYHMTDPTVFYNREDQWQIPREIYGTKPQLVEPYYLITKLPTTQAEEEFITVLPYTPNQRTNLTGWLAARSDGANYGSSLLYDFPKQRLIFGTEQIEARINQDPVISQQISLWNRTGSRALQGNLLVIPIEQSLLYVEPLYLEAEQNSLPTLARVIVAYENRIVMAETLEQGLQAIFQPEQPTAPVVRPVEQ